jgi:hypothetical protein
MTTTATCPVCGRAVDPLRARAVGVKDGRVVAYCSAECQQKAEGKPRVIEDKDLAVRVTVRTPPKGLPAVEVPAAMSAADSGPVIEVIREASEPAETNLADAEPVDTKPRRDPTPVPRRDPTPVPRRDPTPVPRRDPTPVPTATPAKPKRLDTDTRSLQPPDDYDDSDLGPPHEDAPAPRRMPLLAIALVVVLAAVAAAVAFHLN